DGTAALLSSLARNDSGYRLYLLGTAGMAMLVMVPTAFFAGMTLPLFTLALLRGGAGESSIGRLYAANTVGAIVGVLLTVHLLIPVVGVRWALVVAAVTDAAIGLWLLAQARPELSPARLATTAVTVGAVLVLAVMSSRPDPRAQLSSVFRTGHARLGDGMQVRFLRDGKTATIGVARSTTTGVQSLLTNGKSDGAMATRITDPPAGDELTMVTLGALPLALHPRPEQVGVIGWGLGMSTHTVLGGPQVQRVETAEIESMVLQAAPLFGQRIERALHDPRSQVRVDDARHLFSSGNRRYDVIVSEPSNPWVSGVGGLFTHQFYGFLRDHLQDDGVLVQWLQTYEIDDALLASIVAALLQSFPDAQLYLAQDNDLVLVACRSRCSPPRIARWGDGALKRETARIGLDSDASLALRHLGGRALLQTYVKALRGQANDDFHPRLSLEAPRTRFRGDRALALQRMAESGLPILDLMEGHRPPRADVKIPEMPGHRLTEMRTRALRLASSMRTAWHQSEETTRTRDTAAPELALQALLGSSSGLVKDLPTWSEAAADIAAATLGPLAAQDQRGVWIGPGWIDVQTQPPAVRQIMAMYAAAAARDAAAMRREGEAVLKLPAVLSPRLQEQALMIAQLGALGTGIPADVERLHQGYGIALPASEPLRMVRHMIRTRGWEQHVQRPERARQISTVLPTQRIQMLR
ncbi:MAG: fused MFS/spermidine synthase, partial [Pseudoxanthomonas sp.]